MKALIINLFTSGKPRMVLVQSDTMIKYVLLNFICFVGTIIFLYFGFNVRYDIGRALIDFIIAGLTLSTLLLLRTRLPLKLVGAVPIYAVFLACIYYIYFIPKAFANGWEVLWCMIYPLISIFILGIVSGGITSLLLGLALTGMFITTPFYITSYPHPFQEAIRIFIVYILDFSLAVLFEFTRRRKDNIVTDLNTALKNERDTIETMKDNINLGLFLINTKYEIQDQYSKPLTRILSYYDSDLTGKNIIDILAGSLESGQQKILKDYFNMIFEKSHHQKTLEDVNPLYEFTYRTDNTTKIIRTNFVLIDHDENPLILAIFEDISLEKELEKQISEQEEKQQAEIQNLFEVIQIDPPVFADFMEDTDNEFERINNFLKDRNAPLPLIVQKMFQGVHAIKANAAILGLTNFTKILHAFEEEIKETRAKKEITFDDLLHLTFKLEAIMQQRDDYEKTINKVKAFKTANSVEHIFVQSLQRAVEKVAQENNKKAELKVSVEQPVIESKLRKPLKDILFQLIRNSLYHGIEEPEMRIKQGKNPKGIISISIKQNEGKAEIVYTDDGTGLDFKKIKTRLKEVKPGMKAPGEKQLVNAIFLPEFSTAESSVISAGRGVGLNLVKDLVKEYKGNLTVSSGSGKFLTFRILFPLDS